MLIAFVLCKKTNLIFVYVKYEEKKREKQAENTTIFFTSLNISAKFLCVSDADEYREIGTSTLFPPTFTAQNEKSSGLYCKV